jgi:hypothetical protein
MNRLHIAFSIFSALRLTELIMDDRILDWPRKQWPGYLWGCSRCASVWAGIAATLLFLYFPWGNAPLALSWLHGIYTFILRAITERLTKGRIPSPSILLTQAANGNVQVQRNEVSEQQAQAIIVNLASAITNRAAQDMSR